MVSVYFFSYFQRTAIPGTIFDELQTAYALSAVQVAGLGAVFLQVYAWMQLVVGVAADHFGGRRTLTAGGLVLVAGAVAFPLAPTPAALLGIRALTGLGASFMYLSIVQEMDRMVPPRQFVGLMGVVLFGGYAGGIAATLPFERAAAVFGWRTALLAVAALTAASVAVSALLLRRLPPRPAGGAGFSVWPLWDIVRNRRTLPLIVFAVVNFPVYFAVQNVLGKKFLEDFCGLGSRTAATFMLAMMVTGAACTFAGGFVPRLLGHRRRPVLIGATLLVLAGSALLLLAVRWRAPAPVILLAYLLLAAATGAGPASLSTMKELNRPDAVAQSIAVLNCVTYLGVALLAWLGGAVLDRYAGAAVRTAGGLLYPSAAYAAVFTVFCVLALAALAASCLVHETRGEASRQGGGR